MLAQGKAEGATVCAWQTVQGLDEWELTDCQKPATSASTLHSELMAIDRSVEASRVDVVHIDADSSMLSASGSWPLSHANSLSHG